MRGRTGGRVILGTVILLPMFLMNVLYLFWFLLIPSPDAFFALFGISTAQVEWRVADYAAGVGWWFAMLTLFAGWVRAILTYDASAPNACWVRVCGTSCFALWDFANVIAFFV